MILLKCDKIVINNRRNVKDGIKGVQNEKSKSNFKNRFNFVCFNQFLLC